MVGCPTRSVECPERGDPLDQHGVFREELVNRLDPGPYLGILHHGRSHRRSHMISPVASKCARRAVCCAFGAPNVLHASLVAHPAVAAALHAALHAAAHVAAAAASAAAAAAATATAAAAAAAASSTRRSISLRANCSAASIHRRTRSSAGYTRSNNGNTSRAHAAAKRRAVRSFQCSHRVRSRALATTILSLWSIISPRYSAT